jgi:hypothetical protein
MARKPAEVTRKKKKKKKKKKKTKKKKKKKKKKKEEEEEELVNEAGLRTIRDPWINGNVCRIFVD